MRRLKPGISLAAFVLASSGFAAASDHGKSRSDRPSADPQSARAAQGKTTSAPPHFKDLGDHEMPVTLAAGESQRKAQDYFNQGIRLCYAFNHAEAIRAFEEVARLDPKCPMAWWGIAFALGPNINAPMDAEAGKKAFEAAEKAGALAANASERERGYIQAIQKRYAKEPPTDRAALDLAFADAMREVHKQNPDDLDAATIFAESLMDTTPWNYWNEDGSPRSQTVDLVNALQHVLLRDPDHPGANHLFIHAVEASPSPERGLPSAYRLGELMPGAGHLVHMPSHIYLRLGMYDDAAEANKAAIKVDEAYIEQAHPTGLYPAMYYPHNVHFLWYARTMLGQSKDSLAEARKTREVVERAGMHDMPMLEWIKSVPLADMVRFGHWEMIQGAAEPAKDKLVETGIWRFARGMAHLRKRDVDQAEALAKALQELADSKEVAAIETPQFPSQKVLQVAARLLSAEIAGAKGDKSAWISKLEEAVAMQDKLPYMEPPYWYFPNRHFLGAALMETNEPVLAEAVYREDLKQHPRNGWSLFGLLQSLRQQGKTFAASVVQKEFEDAWQYADVTLTASRF